ncbi:MAG: M56 family metallopeptidase [Saprospiraceae bacterium]|nr:M56 family metallopeptidase [Saprospiraceae bacterium]
MESLLLYLAKSALLLGLFYAVYRWLLERETFHQHKRLFLLSGLICAAGLPLLTYTQVVWVAYVPVQDALPALEQVVKTADTPTWHLTSLIGGVYATGVVFLLLQFGIELYSLRQMLRSGERQYQQGLIHVRHQQHIAPFSFFRFLVYNPSAYSPEETRMILLHEQVHARQWHSFDILVGRFFCIFQWWNPLAWKYQQSIKSNLEFIADSDTTKSGANLRDYQYLLLRNSLPDSHVSLANPLFSSSIKKRIFMLHKNPSHPANHWKFGIILPLLAAFFLAFNVKTVAQIQTTKVITQSTTIEETRYVVAIDKNSSDAALEKEAQSFQEHGVTLVFDNIRRNAAGEITGIASSYSDKDGGSGNYSVNSPDPIEPFTFFVSIRDGKKRMGYGQPEVASWTAQMEPRPSAIFFRKEGESDTIKTAGKQFVFVENTGKTHFLADSITVNFESNDEQPGTLHMETTVETSETNGGKVIKVIARSGNNQKEMIINTEEEQVIRMESASPTNQPLIVVDGEEKDADFQMDSINPGDIASVHIWKGEKAIEKFGEKAKNGVIEITLKKK